MITSRTMRLAEYMAEIRTALKILVGRPGGKSQHKRPGVDGGNRRWILIVEASGLH
jgi:hypothetical protein